jgi:hypothetical protein
MYKAGLLPVLKSRYLLNHNSAAQQEKFKPQSLWNRLPLFIAFLNAIYCGHEVLYKLASKPGDLLRNELAIVQFDSR